MRIGLHSEPIPTAELPPSNLVLLVDVSGSMRDVDKLPLLKRALGLLAAEMRPQDHVAIAVYAETAGVALRPTPGSEQARIEEALESLEADSFAAGGAGIRTAYALDLSRCATSRSADLQPDARTRCSACAYATGDREPRPPGRQALTLERAAEEAPGRHADRTS